MKSRFTPAFFANNRRRLRELCPGTDLVVITANGLLQRTGDSTFLFRQDSNFWYLTGINEPDVTLVIDKDKEYLIVPEREETRQTFDGALEEAALTSSSGISTVLDSQAGWKKLAGRLKKVKAVASLPSLPSYEPHHGLYTNPARAALLARLQEQNTSFALEDIRPILTGMRMIKQPAELAAIRAAIDITANTLQVITGDEIWAKFNYEYEIEAAITHGFRTRGAAGHAYVPIVAGGSNACTLHYVANNARLQPGNLVLLDVGAEVENYAADITRTYAYKRPATKRQQAVHEAVQTVQDFALSQLKPGVTMKHYEQATGQCMGEQLRKLGLLREVNHDSIRKYYPHATSHFLGLDVHDTGDYQRPLEPGMVLTVEPGIYIPEEGIGVRIEDDIVITAEGNEVLSASLPKALT